ncbi:MAG TPA: carboxypeptidase-like regulatory domain-containing protein [Pyrinomonadaceae bacterium]|nr:carboxypeptidase-like regulatory domain-containing protein [Pyrinomonadaceae bacterium]
MKHRLSQLIAAAILCLLFAACQTKFPNSKMALQASDYVTGQITSASDRPATSVWVIIKQNGQERGRSLTGDDGSYYINNLGNGQYELLVTKGANQLSRTISLPQNKVFNIKIDF